MRFLLACLFLLASIGAAAQIKGNRIVKSGSGTYTFLNGLTEANDTAALGGTLIEDTQIDVGTYRLRLAGEGAQIMSLFGQNPTGTTTILGVSNQNQTISPSNVGISASAPNGFAGIFSSSNYTAIRAVGRNTTYPPIQVLMSTASGVDSIITAIEVERNTGLGPSAQIGFGSAMYWQVATGDAGRWSVFLDSTATGASYYSTRFETGNGGFGRWLSALELQYDGKVSMPQYGQQNFTGGAATIAGWTDAGDLVEIDPASLGASNYTFENGLTLTGGTVRLGGALAQDTDVATGTFGLTLNGNRPAGGSVLRVTNAGRSSALNVTSSSTDVGATAAFVSAAAGTGLSVSSTSNTALSVSTSTGLIAADIGAGVNNGLPLRLSASPNISTGKYEMLEINLISQGTSAAGLGSYISWKANDAGNITKEMAHVGAVINNATGSTFAADFVIDLADAGRQPAEKFRITSAGVPVLPEFRDATNGSLHQNDTVSQFLVLNPTTGEVQRRAAASISGGAPATTVYENGLTLASGTVRLGGALTRTTAIAGGNFDLDITGLGSFSITRSDGSGLTNTLGIVQLQAAANRALQLYGNDIEFRNPVRFGAASQNDPRMLAGTNTPEGVIAAPPSSLFLRKDGSAGQQLYIKETGTGNTGWTPLAGGGGGGATTYKLGVTQNGDGSVQLGGNAFTENVTINTGNFNLLIEGLAQSTSSPVLAILNTNDVNNATTLEVSNQSNSSAAIGLRTLVFNGYAGSFNSRDGTAIHATNSNNTSPVMFVESFVHSPAELGQIEELFLLDRSTALLPNDPLPGFGSAIAWERIREKMGRWSVVMESYNGSTGSYATRFETSLNGGLRTAMELKANGIVQLPQYRDATNGALSQNDTVSQLLVLNPTTGEVQRRAASSLGGGATTAYENGLTLTGGTVRLGGALTTDAIIDGATNTHGVFFTGVSAFQVQGDGNALTLNTGGAVALSAGNNQGVDITGADVTIDGNVKLPQYRDATNGALYQNDTVSQLLVLNPTTGEVQRRAVTTVAGGGGGGGSSGDRHYFYGFQREGDITIDDAIMDAHEVVFISYQPPSPGTFGRMALIKFPDPAEKHLGKIIQFLTPITWPNALDSYVELQTISNTPGEVYFGEQLGGLGRVGSGGIGSSVNSVYPFSTQLNTWICARAEDGTYFWLHTQLGR